MVYKDSVFICRPGIWENGRGPVICRAKWAPGQSGPWSTEASINDLDCVGNQRCGSAAVVPRTPCTKTQWIRCTPCLLLHFVPGAAPLFCCSTGSTGSVTSARVANRIDDRSNCLTTAGTASCTHMCLHTRTAGGLGGRQRSDGSAGPKGLKGEFRRAGTSGKKPTTATAPLSGGCSVQLRSMFISACT